MSDLENQEYMHSVPLVTLGWTPVNCSSSTCMNNTVPWYSHMTTLGTLYNWSQDSHMIVPYQEVVQPLHRSLQTAVLSDECMWQASEPQCYPWQELGRSGQYRNRLRQLLALVLSTFSYCCLLTHDSHMTVTWNCFPAYLPREQHEREVPGYDGSHHSNWCPSLHLRLHQLGPPWSEQQHIKNLPPTIC